MLIIPQTYRERNSAWEVYTPNELYNDIELSRKVLGYEYADNEALFAYKNKIGGQKVWKEYRIIKATTGLDVTDRQIWWSDRAFMDKVFWCYMKPIKVKVANQAVDFYALEMFECHRVYQILFEKTGEPPFSSQFPGLAIPKECVVDCWTETTNGYADNMRERPDKIITQEEIDRDGRSEELLKQVKPIDIKEIKAAADNMILRPKDKE